MFYSFSVPLRVSLFPSAFLIYVFYIYFRIDFIMWIKKNEMEKKKDERQRSQRGIDPRILRWLELEGKMSISSNEFILWRLSVNG